MSINKVFITGRLTRDAELRTTPSGMFVLGFGVAVNERRKNNQTGQWEDHPVFVDCVMFGTRAEKIAPHLVKGTKVAVEGRLRYNQWEDKNTGQKRGKLDVIVDEIELMSSNRPRQGEYQAEAYDYGDTPPMLPRDSYDNADIPF